MIVVPAGEFDMGSESAPEETSPHRVAVASFAVSRTEVTYDQWSVCVAEGACDRFSPNDQGWGRGQRPVINLDWNQARQYAAWLSRKTGQPYRLLTEAEWEYAARGGATPKTPAPSEAVFADTRSQPVGSRPANPYGLADMAGNVWEWVEDCWNPTYTGAPSDGTANLQGDCSQHVMRGGSWFDMAEMLRPTVRVRAVTENKDFTGGFRVGRRLTEAEDEVVMRSATSLDASTGYCLDIPQIPSPDDAPKLINLPVVAHSCHPAIPFHDQLLDRARLDAGEIAFPRYRLCAAPDEAVGLRLVACGPATAAQLQMGDQGEIRLAQSPARCLTMAPESRVMPGIGRNLRFRMRLLSFEPCSTNLTDRQRWQAVRLAPAKP